MAVYWASVSDRSDLGYDQLFTTRSCRLGLSENMDNELYCRKR